MARQSYHNPENVEIIIRMLARVLGGHNNAYTLLTTEGIKIDRIYRALYATGEFDPRSSRRILLAALSHDDFVTVPAIGNSVRSVQPSDTGIDLYTDSKIIGGNGVLLRLLPLSGSAPRQFLETFSVEPPSTKVDEIVQALDELATMGVKLPTKRKTRLPLIEEHLSQRVSVSTLRRAEKKRRERSRR